MRVFTLFLALVLLIGCDQENTDSSVIQSGNFWDELPANNRYEWIKQRSVDENLRVFDLYEKQKTIKVINVCANAVSFMVQAWWDLEIEDEEGAFELASEKCGGLRAVLLGYTIKSEVKF
jgi:hypothetical protein